MKILIIYKCCECPLRSIGDCSLTGKDMEGQYYPPDDCPLRGGLLMATTDDELCH